MPTHMASCLESLPMALSMSPPLPALHINNANEPSATAVISWINTRIARTRPKLSAGPPVLRTLALFPRMLFLPPTSYATRTPNREQLLPKSRQGIQSSCNGPSGRRAIGPVIDYLANCNGDCSSVDKTALRFFKIDEAGILDGADQSGTWATDKLISNNNSWAVTVPESIAPGNYVLRHEIIALHSAGDQGGAQNYPQCLNLEVTGGRSEKPKGTPGMELYTPKDDGILFNIYQQIDEYPIPGPPVFSGGSGSSPQPPASSTSPSPSAPSTTTQPPRESSKPTTSPADGGSQSSSSSPAQDPKPTSSAPQQTPGPTPSGATPQLPVDLPEDLTPQELLFVAREIVDRLLSKHVQLEVEQK